MKNKLVKYYYLVTKVFHTHEAFVVLFVVLIALIGVIVRINHLSNLPADQVFFDQSSSQIKEVNFNEDAIKKIEELRDSNVQDPGTQLPVDRNNPFNE